MKLKWRNNTRITVSYSDNINGSKCNSIRVFFFLQIVQIANIFFWKLSSNLTRCNIHATTHVFLDFSILFLFPFYSIKWTINKLQYTLPGTRWRGEMTKESNIFTNTIASCFSSFFALTRSKSCCATWCVRETELRILKKRQQQQQQREMYS